MVKISFLSFIFFNLFALQQSSNHDVFDCARKGDLEQMKRLYIDNPDIINTTNNQSYTPLILAAYYNQGEIIDFLISKKVRFEKLHDKPNALQAASFKGFTSIVEKLLSYGLDPNLPDANGITPLIYAVQFGHSDIVKLLVQANADKDYKDANGKTPRDYAIMLGNSEIQELLK
jgi:ankyrin repeat protein